MFVTTIQQEYTVRFPSVLEAGILSFRDQSFVSHCPLCLDIFPRRNAEDIAENSFGRQVRLATLCIIYLWVKIEAILIKFEN